MSAYVLRRWATAGGTLRSSQARHFLQRQPAGRPQGSIGAELGLHRVMPSDMHACTETGH